MINNENNKPLYEKIGWVWITTNDYELYRKPINNTKEEKITIRKNNLFQEIGTIGTNKDNIYKRMLFNDEAVCFIEEKNGIKKIISIFNIPAFSFINGTKETLEEMYNLFFGEPFIAQIEEKQQPYNNKEAEPLHLR